ncbi:hypothetical protein BLL38_19390 [Pseudomonas gessardii]|nr:hypothetical protein BLL38_19390 [Pseudomonas gessardii]
MKLDAVTDATWGENYVPRGEGDRLLGIMRIKQKNSVMDYVKISDFSIKYLFFIGFILSLRKQFTAHFSFAEYIKKDIGSRVSNVLFERYGVMAF